MEYWKARQAHEVKASRTKAGVKVRVWVAPDGERSIQGSLVERGSYPLP